MADRKRPYHKLSHVPQHIADTAWFAAENVLKANGYTTLSKAAKDRLADAIAYAIITAKRS